MATVLPMRTNTNSTGTTTSSATRSRDASLSSFPSSKRSTAQSTSTQNEPSTLSAHSTTSSAHSFHHSGPPAPRYNTTANHTQHTHPRHAPGHTASYARPVKSQYPSSSTEKHVEYILVASFDIDRGSVMEHQYPGPVGGDEHMLAELMLPDQTHLRSQDWTIFFLHKDGAAEDEMAEEARRRRKRRRRRRERQAGGGAEEDGADDSSPEEQDSDDDDDDDGMSDDAESSADEPNIDGPPLVYVLNLVNTKQDHTVKRGAVVKAMAVCTRHSFLHIYKPLLLLALEQYFANPVIETLASLYDAVNSMDLSLMPRLNTFERFILQSSDAKDLFIEKFEAIIAQRMASSSSSHNTRHNSKDHDNTLTATLSPTTNPPTPSPRTRYGLPRDTHEFESVVHYTSIPIPIKIPTALSSETVGDFSLIQLITTFSTPHTTSPQAFTPLHPHLTTGGATTHPIIVLLNALLTQKRVIFLGHNLPSSSVAEAVLAACALASGFGVLRGFTRHAFPYTDLTKIDDLLKVPGFIAGVTNPAFALKPEWWDLLCDLGTGRMRISAKIEPAGLTEGVAFFQQPHNVSLAAGGAGGGASGGPTGIGAIAAAGASLSLHSHTASPTAPGGDATGDAAFMAQVLRAIEERHGENAVRVRFRKWVVRFTRLAAAFEELVYGASALQISNAGSSPKESSPGGFGAEEMSPRGGYSRKASEVSADGLVLPPAEVTTGHGYVWPTPQSKMSELAANATRIEGWRVTRSYYNLVQDLAIFWGNRPVKSVDLTHLHDKLAQLRLGAENSAAIYLAICGAVHTEPEVSQFLAVIVNGVWDTTSKTGSGVSGVGGSGSGAQGGLFHIALGLFHPRREVREAVAELLGRVREHEAGRHFWEGVGRFARRGWERVVAAREAREEGGLLSG